MKLQDVILKAMARKISWMEATEMAGVTNRTMRRIRELFSIAISIANLLARFELIGEHPG